MRSKQELASKVAARLASQNDEPIWSLIDQDRQWAYLSQAMGLLSLVDEAEPSATVLCAHCPKLVPATSKKCTCCSWPACGKCAKVKRSGHKRLKETR